MQIKQEMNDYFYAIRIYENTRLNKFIGPNRKNVDVFNGSVDLYKKGKWFFDLRHTDKIKIRDLCVDGKKQVSAMITDLQKRYLEYEYNDNDFLAAQLLSYDKSTKQRQYVLGCIVLNLDSKELAVHLHDNKIGEILFTAPFYVCPEDSKKNTPVFFTANHDLD